MLITYIILDLDNTLYNYTKINNFCYNQIKKQLSNIYNLDETIFKAKKIIKNQISNTASSHNRLLYFQKICELLNLPLTKAFELNKIYWESFYSNIKLNNGVLELFKYLKKNKIKIGILTNFTVEHQYKKLDKLHILQYIDTIVTSEEVGIEKPNIKMFNTILKKINIPKENILVVGDDYNNDIHSTNNLNMFACYYKPNDKLNINNSYITFNSFYILLEFIKNINNGINELYELSNFFGQRFDLTQAGGGNISVKVKYNDKQLLIIKSSGYNLSDLTKDKGYTLLLKKEKLINCPSRPSIETSMHLLLKTYTIHLHPIQCNIILTQKNCNKILKNLFPKALIINYFTPGEKLANAIKKKYNDENIIFLLNHGLIVTSDNIDDIYLLIENTINILEQCCSVDFNKYKLTNKISKSFEKIFNKKFVSYLTEDIIINKNLNNIDYKILTPDQLIYCGNYIIKINNINELDTSIKLNKKTNIIIINNNIYIISKNLKKCKEIEDVLKSYILISMNNNDKIELSNNEINYLLNWEAEKYRMAL